jgi:hypothetical protein
MLNNLKALKGSAVDYGQRLRKEKQRDLPMSITSDNEYATMGDYIGGTLIDQSASILTSLAMFPLTPLIGGVNAARITASVFGVMEGGGDLLDSEIAQKEAPAIIKDLEDAFLESTNEEEKLSILEDIKFQEKALNVTQFQKSLSAGLYAAAGYYGEKFGTLAFMKNFQKYSSGVGVNAFKSKVFPAIGRAVKKSVGAVKGVGIGVGVENIEETLTTLGQNFTSIYVMGQDKSILDGIDKDFFASSTISSLAISGPMASQNIYSAVASEFASKKENKQNRALVEDLQQIEESLQSDKLTQKARRLLRTAKRDKIKKLALNSGETILKLKDFSSSEVNDILDINQDIRRIMSQASELRSGGDTSTWSKSQLSELKKDFVALENKRNNIFKNKDQEASELFKDSKNSVDAVANYALFNYSKNLIGGQDGIKSFNFKDDTNKEGDVTKTAKDSYREYLEVLVLPAGEILTTEEITEYLEAAFPADGSVGVNAANVGNDVLLFEDNVVNTIGQSSSIEAMVAAVSPMHELGHIQARKAGIVKDDKLAGDGVKMVESIVSKVENLAESGVISKEVLKAFNDRIDLYRAEEKDNNQREESKGVDVDELIQLVNDFTNIGALPKSSFKEVYEIKRFVNSAYKLFNGDASMYFRFDDAESIFQFVSSWTSKAEKGTQIVDDEEDDSKNIKSSKSLTELKQDLESLNEREFEFSEQAEFDSQVSNLNLKIKQAEKKEATGKSTSLKNTVTAKQTASSEKVQKLYEEKKEGYEAEIIKEFEPSINKIVQTRRNVPGFDEVKLKSALTTGPQGLLDLINKYNKDVNAETRDSKGEVVPIAAYINKYLRTRSIAIFDKNLDKTFTEGLDKASKVAAEQTSKTSGKDVKLIKATKLLNPWEYYISKEIVSDTPMDLENLSYKKIKGITSEITSEVTGIPMGKIGNPAKNLSKGETTAAAMFISKNIDYIRNTLPEGAVLEGASEKLIGTSTGVPKKMLDAFYVKSKRGNNLSPFILRKGLTNNEILEVIGRPKDGKPRPIDPRSPNGSVIKGLIDVVDKNITNELVRTQKDLTQQQQVDAGAGRSRMMFSKSVGPKAATEAVVTNLGFEALNTKNPAKRKEAVSYMYNDFFPKMFETFGEETLSVLKATNIAPSGNVGGSLIKRSQLFINNIKRAAKGNKEQKNQKAETEALLESGEVGQLEDLLNLYEDWKKINNPKAKSENVKTSIRGQKGKDLEKNLASLKEHKAGYKEFLNLFKDLYASDPSTIRGIQYLMYNQNANSHFYRNLAQLTGIEAGLKKGESREEHVYQAGVWAVRTLQAMTSKNPKVWEGWLDWSSKNYYQEAIKGKKGSLAEGEYIQSEKIIDGIYRENRLTGESLEELRSQSQEHPLLKEALDEAFKTGDFSKVPEANIRKYNDYITLNPNVITREGITDAKRYDVEVPSKFDQNSNVISKQGEIIFKVIKDEMSLSEAKQAINEYLKIADSVTEAAKSNNDQAPKIIRYSKTISNKQSIDMLAKTDKALDNARKLDAPIKKIRV